MSPQVLWALEPHRRHWRHPVSAWMRKATMARNSTNRNGTALTLATRLEHVSYHWGVLDPFVCICYCFHGPESDGLIGTLLKRRDYESITLIVVKTASLDINRWKRLMNKLRVECVTSHMHEFLWFNVFLFPIWFSHGVGCLCLLPFFVHYLFPPFHFPLVTYFSVLTLGTVGNSLRQSPQICRPIERGHKWFETSP